MAKEEESAKDGFKSAIIVAGTPIIKGLDKKTYWLEETKAPAGYNSMTDRIEVNMEDGDNLIVDGHLTKVNNDLKYTSSNDEPGGGVQVINKKGNILPSTGGIGTTIFYVIGAILVICMGGALILRSRKGREAAQK